jgi:hypothetical protein
VTGVGPSSLGVAGRLARVRVRPDGDAPAVPFQVPPKRAGVQSWASSLHWCDLRWLSAACWSVSFRRGARRARRAASRQARQPSRRRQHRRRPSKTRRSLASGRRGPTGMPRTRQTRLSTTVRSTAMTQACRRTYHPTAPSTSPCSAATGSRGTSSLCTPVGREDALARVGQELPADATVVWDQTKDQCYRVAYVSPTLEAVMKQLMVVVQLQHLQRGGQLASSPDTFNQADFQLATVGTKPDFYTSIDCD